MTRPTIDSLSKDIVEKDWEGNITICGHNFTDPCEARFDGTPCGTTFVSSQEITVAVTKEITSAPATLAVRVVNDDGEISNDLDFIVKGALAAVAPGSIDPDAGFGILSSVQFNQTPLQKLFNLGTARPVAVKETFENVTYVGSELRKRVKDLCDNSQVAVIITFGGNVSAAAAANYSTRPFLSILGNLTPQISASAQLSGGINLDTAARNAERFNYLNQELNIPAEQICLLSNPDSAMASEEQDQWSQIFQAGDILRAKNLSQVITAFNSFQNNGTLTTMIVSADPFFQSIKHNLIIAANNSGKKVCYPLQAYSNLGGTARPAPGRHWLYGPKLARACFQLGRDAAEVLKNRSKLPLRVPPMLRNSNNDES